MPTLEETGADLLIDERPEYQVESAPEEFHICDEDSANWLLRRLGNLEAERERVKAQAVAMLAAIDQDYNRLWERFGADLEQFARKRLAHVKRKSLPLIQGTCAFRTIPLSIKVEDREVAMRAVFDDPELHECIKPVLDAANYREAAEKRLRATGEVLPGIKLTPEHENFSVRFPASKEG